VRDGASFLMAMSPLAIMHDGILFPVCDSTFSSSCATARFFALESAAFSYGTAFPSSVQGILESLSARRCLFLVCDGTLNRCATARVSSGASAPSFHGQWCRFFPRARSALDSISARRHLILVSDGAFSAPAPLSSCGISFPCATTFFLHARRRLLLVSDGAFTQRAIAPLSSCGTSFPCVTAFFLHVRRRLLLVSDGAFTQCAIAPLSSCAILPVCDGIVPSCATAPPLMSDGALTQCHCASPLMRAGAFLDRLRWRTPFVCDGARNSCAFFPRATMPSSGAQRKSS
jgi:hypothetical protein